MLVYELVSSRLVVQLLTDSHSENNVKHGHLIVACDITCFCGCLE